MKSTSITSLFGGLLLAGCATVAGQGPTAPVPAAPVPASIAPAPGAAPGSADTCGRAAFDGLIGQPVGDAAAFRGAGVTFRVIYPGDTVPDDLVADRINIYADTVGTITSLDCF